jgi:hypothetical protein
MQENEIQITPEMKKAGAEALFDSGETNPGPWETWDRPDLRRVVEVIYRTMERVRIASSKTQSDR